MVVVGGQGAAGAQGVQAPPEVLVVAYGAPELLGRALAPLAGSFAVTVVDNSSRDDVRDVATSAGARYLDPGRNGGFAAGVNHGVAHRQRPGADLLLLNPDAVIGPAAVRDLQAALHARPRTASVAPSLHDGRGAPSEVEWVFPSPFLTWADAVRQAHRFRGAARFVSGAVLLIDGGALAAVGRFDDRFFLYFEETDWQYRAVRAGWSNRVVPEVEAVHLGGGTSPDGEPTSARFRASHERYLRKHHGALGWHVARAAVVTGAAARMALRRGERRARARQRLRLYAHAAGPQLARLGDADALAVVR